MRTAPAPQRFEKQAWAGALCGAALLFACPERSAGGERLAEGIQDNSFFVEEAYNQEPGVVQHIFLGVGTVNQFRGPDDREWALSFTQEWPVFTQAHQFSYTLPYTFLETGGRGENGVGDIVLNYRYQALFESERMPAFAPRVSVILPTGDDDRELGTGETGYQLNLPVSKVLSERWTGHFNAGATWYPDVQDESLVSYSLSASAIYAVSRNFNVMLEAVASWDEDLGEVGGTTREFSAFLSPGLRYGFDLPNDGQVVAGLAAPIGVTGSAPDYGILFYLSIEHSFLQPRSSTGSGK